MSDTFNNDSEIEKSSEDSVEDSEVLFSESENPDLFWIVRRVGGGLLKSVFVLLIIGIILYFIFGNGFFPIDKIKSIFTTSEKSEAPLEKKKAIDTNTNNRNEIPSLEKNNSENASSDNFQDPKNQANILGQAAEKGGVFSQNHLEKISEVHYALTSERTQSSNNRISQGVVWLKNTQNLGNFSLNSLSQDPLEVRSRRIHDYLGQVEKTLTKSDEIVRPMQEEVRVLEATAARLTERVKKIDAALFFEIKSYNQAPVLELMEEKIGLQQTLVEVVEQRRIRLLLIKNMQQYANLLQRKQVPLYKLLRVKQ